MSKSTRLLGIQSLIDQFFSPHTHPYRILDQHISENLRENHALLEIGCGRSAPTLVNYKGRAKKLLGIDVVEFEIEDPELELHNTDVGEMSVIQSGSVDLCFSRSVMEHIENAESAYAEIQRVLKPDGKYIFLTPNFWDYASLIAHLTPNRFHGTIVKIAEGREEKNTFPTYFQSNTYTRICKLSKENNFDIALFQYLGQYPNYFMFSKFLFYWGCRYEIFLERHPKLHFLRGWIFCILSKRS